MKAKKKSKLTKIIIPIVIILGIIGCFSCSESELEKVIQHYKKENNQEKLKAAQFLIHNMNTNFSYVGKAYENYREIYNSLANVPKKERDKLLRSCLDTINLNLNPEVKSDKKIIKAEYLIKHIDNAYSIWQNSRWTDEVNFENFCEYVLPYKCGNEGITDYLNEYNKIYSIFLNSISFDGGERYYAINQNHTSTSIVEKKYNQQKLVTIAPNTQSLFFKNIFCSQKGTKTLFIQYTNVKHWNMLQMIVNNEDTLNVKLKPLDDLLDIPIHPLKLTTQFRQGENTVELIACNDTLAIEYIEVAPFEKYYLDEINFEITDGANYTITNVANNKCLTIDKSTNSNKLFAQTYNQEKNQIFNIQNVNYGFFCLFMLPLGDTPNSLEVLNSSKLSSANIVSNSFQLAPQQMWAIIPVEKHQYKIINKLSGKCLQTIANNNQIVQNEYSGSDNQHWNFQRADTCISFSSDIHVKQNSILEATRRIAEELDFNWQTLSADLPEFTAVDILNTKIGNCYAEAQFQLYILRSLGIPTVIDFMPLCARSTQGHEFNSIIGKDNKAIYCQVNMTPGTGHIKLPVSKVYRKNFSTNLQSLAVLKEKDENIPHLFDSPHLIDVTSDYSPTADANVELFDTHNIKNKHAYLCVNNKQWLPVSWGSIKNKNCLFKNLGIDVLYLPVYYYDANNMDAAGYPFILKKDNTNKKIIPITDSLQTFVLKRKFLWGGEWSDGRMNGGEFQGANKADFSDAETIYKFKGNTEPIFYNLPVNCNKKFSFVRYFGANGSYSTLCELSFKDENDVEIIGSPIGTPKSFKDLGNTIEKVFDKDILTYFEGSRPDSTWVGLKLEKPASIKTIRFMPRNDGNCIEKGDEYELEYWNNFEWVSLGRQFAQTDSLVYNNCPKNALYILHNYTKGFQERVFIMEQGKQIFY